MVSAMVMNTMATAAASNGPMSSNETWGTAGLGNPSGMLPTTATPFSTRPKLPTTTVAPTTAMSTPGIRRSHTRSPTMTARQASPITREVMFTSPSTTPSTHARNSFTKPSASVENPQRRGNWLTRTTAAMPFR